MEELTKTLFRQGLLKIQRGNHQHDPSALGQRLGFAPFSEAASRSISLPRYGHQAMADQGQGGYLGLAVGLVRKVQNERTTRLGWMSRGIGGVQRGLRPWSAISLGPN